MIEGQNISIRPATANDRRKIFEWLTQSNLTKLMMGPPDFSDQPIPTWEEFLLDYHDAYFGENISTEGHCFIILADEEEVGQINFNTIHAEDKSTELDIWLAGEKFSGKGHGTKAIDLLCRYLFEDFGVLSIYIAPSQRNIPAIKAYHKCGFRETGEQIMGFEPDYDDAVSLVKHSFFQIVKDSAMSFPNVTIAPHFDKTSFRINNKIFATWDFKANRLCLKLSEKDQDIFGLFDNNLIYPVPNKWGKQGWTLVESVGIPKEMIIDLVRTAYEEVSSKKKKG
jgi:diamine N-acetyltransferase